MIIGCITVFFAAISGCIDSGIEEKGSLQAGWGAAICSFIAWVFIMTAYCVWSAFPYVQSLQSSSANSVWVPVWVNQDANQMSALQTNGLVYGPGFGTAIAASIIIFFCTVVHCASLVDRRSDLTENVTPQPRPEMAEDTVGKV
jgi:hypothetical protein